MYTEPYWRLCDIGELQIDRLSSSGGIVTGEEELFILTKKIKKGAIELCYRIFFVFYIRYAYFFT